MSTETIPTTPNKPEVFWNLWKLSPVFGLMALAIWVLLAWVQDGRDEQTRRIDKLEKMVDDCATSKKDRIESGIDEILRRLPEPE